MKQVLNPVLPPLCYLVRARLPFPERSVSPSILQSARPSSQRLELPSTLVASWWIVELEVQDG